MKTRYSHPGHSVEASSTSGRAVGPPHDSCPQQSGRTLPLALLLALVLGAAWPVHSAVLQGPVFPWPGGLNWTDENAGVDGAIGHAGGKNWSFSNIVLATQTLTYWGPSNANAIALSFFNRDYTNGEHVDFAPALSDLAQGRAVWTGRTPLPPPTGWWDLADPATCTVAQSTSYPNYPASYAIDGNTNNFTHTLEGDPAPWWEVAFGGEVPIVTVYLYNRRDCCADRLRDITVNILLSDGQTNWTSPVLNPNNELGSPEFLQVTPPPGTTGQKVRVSRNVDGIPITEGPVLSLAEVYVHTGIQTRFTLTVTNLADGQPLSLTNAASVGLDPNVGALLRVTPGLAFRANLLFEARLVSEEPYLPAMEYYSNLCVAWKFPDATNAYSDVTCGFYYYEQTLPTIDPVPDQITARGTPSGPHLFSVGDNETPLEELVVTATSDNQTLVPDANIELSGEGAGRQIFVTPVAGEGGSCTITLYVNDGFGFASTSFLLTVDDPPTINPVSDQFIQQDLSTGPLSFTIGDTETPAAGLVVTAYSSNFELVPPANLVLGGSDTERTVTVTPLPGQAGQALITLNVEDAAQSTSIIFRLTVNGRPAIPDLPNLLIQQDTPTAALALTIGDWETPAAELGLVKDSSNPSLVPLENIVFGGSESNRTVTLTPAPGGYGVTTISIGVSDGSITNFDTFVLTVNGRPTISDVPDQITQRDESTAPIPFVIGDPETPADQLVVTASSSNLELVPLANITLGGSGPDRTITLNPVRGKTGLTTITLAVADDSITNHHSFLLKVNNRPSLAANNALTVQRGGSGTITDQLLLTTDPESGPTNLVYTVGPGSQGGPPHNGSLYLNGVMVPDNGTFTQDDIDSGRMTYTHDGQCATSDDFTFNVSDPDRGVIPTGQFTTYTFRIQIEHPNIKPVAINGHGDVPLNARFQSILQATNGDCVPQTLVFRVVTPPANGTVTVDNPNSGAFSYRPRTNYAGPDAFTFQVNDGVADADAPGTFTLMVANQPSAALDGQGTTREDVVFQGQLSASDPDLPPQLLTFILQTQPAKGNVVVTDAGTGAFTYTPNTGAIGQDSFTFRVTDGLTNSVTRAFSIGIRPRLDPGDLLVTDLGTGALILIDPTGAQALISSTNLLLAPQGLAVEAQGTIMVKDKISGLVRVNATDGSQTLVSPATNFVQDDVQTFGLTVEANGSILVPDGTNGLLRVNPMTGVASVLSAGDPFVYPKGVTVAPDGTIFVTDLSAMRGQPSRVIRVQPGSGAATLVTTNNLLVLPTGIAVDGQGMLLVADGASFAGPAFFDMVVRVNPADGSQTLVSTNGLLALPTGLALGSDGAIFTLNLMGRSVVKIDPVTGAQSLFSSGGLLTQPLGLAVVALPSSRVHLTLVQVTSQQVNVRLEGTAGRTYELRRSTDLVSWSKVDEGTAGLNGVLDLHDTNPPDDQAFYRAIER